LTFEKILELTIHQKKSTELYLKALFYSKQFSQEFRSIFFSILFRQISTKEKKTFGIHRRKRKEKK